MANRNINGLTFEFVSRHRKKSEAQKVADGYRQRGIVRRVRIIKTKTKTGIKYDIWVWGRKRG
jgi:hypothetical protein